MIDRVEIAGGCGAVLGPVRRPASGGHSGLGVG